MKILSLVQGTPEWHQHRATHFNASDAPAMLGVSAYKSRRQLLDEFATGLRPEIDTATQRRFDDGHRAEALARPLAEKIIGDELYPVIGVPDDGGKLSASFDGLTLDEATAWEHKSMNHELCDVLSREGCTGADLPEMYRVQMEQQALVSGAGRVLFMVSSWAADGSLVEEMHCWYTPDPALRARIVAGWAQFERDLAEHKPQSAAPAAVGRAPETLPALRVEAQGMVTFSNLAEFRANAMQILGSINRDLKTDQDFADAEQAVKDCKVMEDRLESAKANVLAQMQSVDEVCRTIDAVSEETRKVRLELDRLVKSEKEHRRAEIVQHYADQVRAHYASINATLGEHALVVPATVTASIGNAIKGRKTLGSITDAADAACAAAKIDASQQAERVRLNIAALSEFADHAHLFADRVALCATKSPEDLRNLAAARIAEHAKREAERLEAERARIRREEEARAERLRQQAYAEAERVRKQAESERLEAECQAEAERRRALADDVQFAPDAEVVKPISTNAPPFCLRDINAAIAPLSITADGLAHFGFQPIAKQRAAKLYAAADFDRIRAALIVTLQRATLQQEQAA